MIIYKLILLLLDSLIKEFEVRIKLNKKLASKYKENLEFADDLPLFHDDNAGWELVCEEIVLTHDTKECKEILQTIRKLEYIIKRYFNNKYVKYSNKEFNPQ